ncbi:GL27201 [Drosophila persimilis]|uniref:Protein cereblon n=1 Tax=Drosophila persimilis TaxID=7234 RepID=CRBN_DROPE|nr:protein cereblon homolog [Drosophila persimilis]B4GZ07.1 RecName: Full=Protein cereblon; AltName: Full=Protein ohgata [Drosophila persimilis]EDW28025.1 GL27201 [Drosophila persimilis]
MDEEETAEINAQEQEVAGSAGEAAAGPSGAEVQPNDDSVAVERVIDVFEETAEMEAAMIERFFGPSGEVAEEGTLPVPGPSADGEGSANAGGERPSEEDIVLDDGTESDGSYNRPGSDMSLDSPNSEDDSDVEAMPRWMIPQNRLRFAVDMMVSQARNQDGGIAALLNRDNFLQRVRSMVFSQERRRSRNSDEVSPEAEDDELPEHPPPPPPRPPIDIDMEEGVHFDTNLPAEHSYFGPNLNRVPGVNYQEVGSTHHMLIFLHQYILFPGEVLPFMIDGSLFDDDMSGLDGLIFAVAFPLMKPPEDSKKLYGVTCQIYEKGDNGRHLTFYKSRALQRIVINCSDIKGLPQYIARNPTNKCHSKVKILPEYFLPEPLKCIDMGSMSRFRDIPSMRDKYLRYQISSTPWPVEVCQEYAYEDIVERARKKLEVHKIDTMPKCPIQMSFWLVRNLHLTEKMMSQMFLTDSVNLRLQLIGGILKEETLFYCRYCNSSLAYCSDLFAMSKHGVQTQYCNPGGYIHETNTVYRVISHAIGYSGEPSTRFSWFPGYQWHIILCKFCAQHVGWEFKAVEPNLAPKVFYGLAGSSVRIGKAGDSATVNGNNFVVRNMLRVISEGME